MAAQNNVSILDGNTFVVSDYRGDIEATSTDTFGLFLNDTRFLSKWVLTVDGTRPALLSTDDLAYFRVQFFLAVTTGTIYVNSEISLCRKRAVGGGFHEDIIISNHGKAPVDLEVRLEMDADFADLFEVKDKLTKKGEFYKKVERDALQIGYRREKYHRATRVTTSQPAAWSEDGLTFKVHVDSHSSWATCVDVATSMRPEQEQPKVKYCHGESEPRPELAHGIKEAIARAPKVVSSWEPLKNIYNRSLLDLAALRFETKIVKGALPAAGLPWFMAVFGRDSLLTSFQALPFVPELARTTLEMLGIFQGRIDDPFREEEPGKILHELRLGELTAFEERPQSPYFGGSDTTPLYLIVLEEYDRWTDDHAFVREHELEARAAIDWIDKYGDKDGDGYVEYEWRNKETGLVNQCWKDSPESIAFSDGRLAEMPRAVAEIQGYVHDAKRRTARLARDVWNDPKWADKLESEAAALKERFNRDFWMPKRDFYALALDGRKRQVDSLTSNVGHLFWSGIVDADKADPCAKLLMSDLLFSGWGIRTMARGEGSYNPIGYHVGAVWPHDNSLIAWGLRQYGYNTEAARICRALLEAAEFFHGRLPEAFAGYSRQTTKYPVEYPTACSPQAWASGAPLLFIRTLLGLESDGRHMIVEPALIEPIHRLELLDVPGPWGLRDAFGRARLAA